MVYTVVLFEVIDGGVFSWEQKVVAVDREDAKHQALRLNSGRDEVYVSAVYCEE